MIGKSKNIIPNWWFICDLPMKRYEKNIPQTINYTLVKVENAIATTPILVAKKCHDKPTAMGVAGLDPFQAL